MLAQHSIVSLRIYPLFNVESSYFLLHFMVMLKILSFVNADSLSLFTIAGGVNKHTFHTFRTQHKIKLNRDIKGITKLLIAKVMNTYNAKTKITTAVLYLKFEIETVNGHGIEKITVIKNCLKV